MIFNKEERISILKEDLYLKKDILEDEIHLYHDNQKIKELTIEIEKDELYLSFLQFQRRTLKTLEVGDFIKVKYKYGQFEGIVTKVNDVMIYTKNNYAYKNDILEYRIYNSELMTLLDNILLKLW